MCHTHKGLRQKLITRRFLLWLGGLALIYPLLRFIGYTVPKKPKSIEVNTLLPASGFLVAQNFILFDADGKTWAVSRKCTHLGCKINYHEQDHLLECPCHQSQFSITGMVMKGPAKKTLAIYPVEKRDTAPYYIVTI